MRGDVCAAVVQTQLCGPSDRRAALAALVCSTGGDAEPRLTDAGCQAAALCGAVRLDNLAGSLGYQYRLHAIHHALTDLPQTDAAVGLTWHARLIFRDTVYAAAAHADRTNDPAPESWGGADGCDQSEVVIDSLQQNG